MQGTWSLLAIHTHLCYQVVENNNVVLSGGYVDLTVANSPSQSNSQQVLIYILLAQITKLLLLIRKMTGLHQQ